MLRAKKSSHESRETLRTNKPPREPQQYAAGQGTFFQTFLYAYDSISTTSINRLYGILCININKYLLILKLRLMSSTFPVPTGLLQNVDYNVLLAHEKGLLIEINFSDMLPELKLVSTVVVPHLDWYRLFSVYGRPARMLRGIVDMRDDVLANPSPLTFSRQQFFLVQMMPEVESVQKSIASKMGFNFNACVLLTNT